MRLIEDFNSINGLAEHFAVPKPTLACTTKPVELKNYCGSLKPEEIIPKYSVADETDCVGESPHSTQYVFSNKSYKNIRDDHLKHYETKLKDIYDKISISGVTKTTKDEEFKKLVCLLGGMIETIHKNKCKFKDSSSRIDTDNTKLENDKKRLESYEKRIENNDNTGLVGKFRNENTEKVAKRLNIYFILYVTFIVVFLIVEGILFFV